MCGVCGNQQSQLDAGDRNITRGDNREFHRTNTTTPRYQKTHQKES